MNNQKCSVRPTLIHFNFDEIHYYPFIISQERCNGTYNTADYPFGRMCVSNKREDVNLKVFNMIKRLKESKTLAKYISCEFRWELDGRKCNSRQTWKKGNCQCECTSWNPSTCACGCDKDCEIGKCLKDYKCMKSFVDDLVVKCDEIEDTPEPTSTNLNR